MPSPTHLKSIAIVGATGNLGTKILTSILSTQRFTITVISRSSSPSPSLPPSVVIKRGDYTSSSFLASAFSGIEAAIFALHWSAVPELETQLIEAAAAAGVKWILPAEFGSDNANEELAALVPVAAAKAGPRKRVEELAEQYEGLKWVGVVTNPWLDFSLKSGMFQIDIKNKKATLLSGGTAKFNTTNLPTVGLAVARLLSLPIESTDGGVSLSDFANRFVYIRSFLISQREILSAVQRVTGTTDADWTIEHIDAQEFIDQGAEKLAKGDFMGTVNLLYGSTMKEGAGGNYESVRGVSNGVLRLPEEDLDDSVKSIVEQL